MTSQPPRQHSAIAWIFLFNPLVLAIVLYQTAAGNNSNQELFPELVQRINESHAHLIKSGSADGRLLLRYKDFEDDEPSTLIDCDFSIIFDGEKIRFERNYNVHELTRENPLGTWGTEGTVRQILISRGTENYWLKFDEESNCSYIVLNRTWCDMLLRNADCPAPHPMRVWDNMMKFVNYKDVEWKVTSMNSGGILAEGRKPNFWAVGYLLPPKPLRFSRLVITAGNPNVPPLEFRTEYNLAWSSIQDTSFVKRYSNYTTYTRGKEKREIRIEVSYSQFRPNLAVDDTSFELSSLNIPVGTEFRANAPVPMKYIFDGQGLIPSQSEQCRSPEYGIRRFSN